MELCAVAAVDRGWLLGRDGQLPWRLPDELRWFKSVTMRYPVVMGRRTYQSIGRALPGRANIVLSRAPQLEVAAGVQRVSSFEEALRACEGAERVMVIGGGALYALALPQVQTLYLSVIDARLDGDVRLPALHATGWEVVSAQAHEADARHAYAFVSLTLRRAASRPALDPAQAEVPEAWLEVLTSAP